MSDLIDRQAAIDGILHLMPPNPNADDGSAEQLNFSAWKCALTCAEASIKMMPSAQPKRTEERTETHACDLIDRQVAIDALNVLFKKQVTQFGYEGYEKADEKTQLVCDGISYSIGCVLNLPTAQPDTCEGCKWEDAFGYGECGRCRRRLEDMYERGTCENG